MPGGGRGQEWFLHLLTLGKPLLYQVYKPLNIKETIALSGL